MEVDCAKAAMHMLVEKPISMRPAEEVERLAQVWYDHSHEQPTLNLYIMYAMSAVVMCAGLQMRTYTLPILIC